MRYSVFSGDPRIVIDEDGADLVFKGGNPIMDRGIENAAIISLFSDSSWWGNGLLDAENRIGSLFETSTRQAITRTALVDMASAAETDLAWMVDSGLAADVSATVSAPQSRAVDAAISITPPGGGAQMLLLKKHGVNWIFQATDPANERIE